MKISILYSSLIILFITGCKKDPDPEKPSVKIAEVSNITGVTATVSAEVITRGDSPLLERGFCWSKNNIPNPNLNENDGKLVNDGELGPYTDELTGLEPGKLYYIRAYATNNGGTAYSNVLSFRSLIILPLVKTANITSITEISATGGGEVTSDGGADITTRGVCWGTSPNPTISDNKTSDGAGLGAFTSSIPGLKTNTAYFVRAYATNIAGTGYGPSVLLSTVPGINFNPLKQYETTTDIDGNTYKTIQIGTQVWMAENLRVSRYRNGDTIQVVSDLEKWTDMSLGARCQYNNNLGYMPVYGNLYNWYAVNEPRTIAPEGWHIPSVAEWETLISYLSVRQGSKLKEKGSKHWQKPNLDATNESGFTALPGGFRYRNLGFDDLSFSANWWSTSENGDYATIITLGYDQENITKNLEYKTNGYSVRCLKD